MTMYKDPRLTDPVLLVLAGKRLQHRLSQPQFPPWEQVEGLSALLDHARRLPPVPPWDIPGVFEGAKGFGGLLHDARQWSQEEHGHGA